MQGTVKTYDPATRSGVILNDGKSEFRFDQQSFWGSGLRELRLGQRVKFNVEGEGPNTVVRDLTIVTL